MSKDIFRALEADFGDEDWITVVREGESINGRNYHKEALQLAVADRAYEGQKMFVDHSDGPPLKRSMRELVAAISETKFVDGKESKDGLSRIRGKVDWIDLDFKGFAERAKEHIGVSHDARLIGTRSRSHDGRRKEEISKIQKVHSVDWVIYPSAGGGYEEFIAKEGVEMPDAIDWSAITPDMLKDNAPDLYSTLEKQFKPVENVERGTEQVEDGNDDGPVSLTKADVKKLVADAIIEAKESVRADESKRLEAGKKIAAKVNAAPLPEKTRARIIRTFADAEEFEETRVQEAIDEAKEELKDFRPRVTRMGPSGSSKSGSTPRGLGRAHESVAAAFGIKPEKAESNKDEGKE